MKTRLAAVSIAALALAGSAATADIVTYTSNAAGPIADNATLDLDHVVNPGDGPILSLDEVRVTLFHSWVGDLLVSLTHVESGVSVVLFDRPGVPPIFGNSDDLAGTYSFVMSAQVPMPEAGGQGVVPPGAYLPAGDFSVFAGVDTAGTWRLSVTDGASGDTGRVEGFGWTVTTVPTPGAAALAGLGTVALFRRRRQTA